MADEKPKPELLTLEECQPKVKITLHRDCIAIAEHLQQQDVFNDDVYDLIVGFHSAGRDQLFFQKLCNAVNEDTEAYRVFVDFLRQDPMHKSVVESLDKEYAEQMKNIES